MGKINSRSKGARAEREVVKIFQENIDKVYEQICPEIQPPSVERNLQQFVSGGHDLRIFDWLAVEVKHCEKFQLSAWWKQAEKQACVSGGIPVLMYRKNRVPWRVRMMGANIYRQKWKKGDYDWQPVLMDISLEDFLSWFCAELGHRIG